MSNITGSSLHGFLHPWSPGQYGVVWCGVVLCGVVWCGVVWCGVVWCGVVWCGVVWCGVVWCGVVWCGVVWCGVVWCSVVWFGVVELFTNFFQRPFSPALFLKSPTFWVQGANMVDRSRRNEERSW